MVSGAEASRSSTAGRRLRPGVTALLLGLAVFGLFGVTAGQLTGYEPETAAVSEGLVKIGQPRVLPTTRLVIRGVVVHGGHSYGRTGLTQPVLEVPFYWLGDRLDQISSHDLSFRWRGVSLQLFNPAMAALTVVAIFGLLLLRGVTERRALMIAVLCAVGTLIWPYSKIGMDTTLMAMLAMTVFAAAWAVNRPTTGRMALLGCSVAMTINSKPYGALLLLGVLPLLLPTLLRLVREHRVRVVGVLAVPVIAGLAVFAWYNWYRTGSVTNTGYALTAGPLLAMPISAAGLLISPGKGLVFYSPLVVLGILGLRELWRRDGPLAATVVLTASINIVLIAIPPYWADETWGPRYIVPTAWLLVLPIAWWLTTRRRRRWLAAVAVAAVCFQFGGVFASYVSVAAADTLAGGESVYLITNPTGRVAYGDDGPRWVPQASPLLFNLELTAAYLKEKLTGTGFTVTYAPYRGTGGTLNLTHPEREFGPLPDFWWTGPRGPTTQILVVALLALVCLGAVGMLVRRHLPRDDRRGPSSGEMASPVQSA
jgi:hypothetical protein